jgi:flagellar hook-basal body complex protein FliE
LVNAEASNSEQVDFAGFIDNQIQSINDQIQTSDAKLRELASGESANLHDVMLSLEKAKLSMELLLQIRNKTLEAYQELMRTQL